MYDSRLIRKEGKNTQEVPAVAVRVWGVASEA